MQEATSPPLKEQSPSNALPDIPSKRYFTIGEVGQLCLVKPHVLRYWEQEFPQLNPSKRRNRRYYQYRDVVMIRQIYHLLYEQGYTIEGARGKLSNQHQNPKHPVGYFKSLVKDMIGELEEVQGFLKA